MNQMTEEHAQAAPSVHEATLCPTRTINAAGGYPIHRSVLGHNWVFHIADQPRANYIYHLRGVSDGLKADNYDWKRIARPFMHKTTLEFLRTCRDFGTEPMITANVRGIVDPNAKPDVYIDTSAESLAQQAADWAYYCNHIVRTYRQGDRIQEQRARQILNELAWGDADLLLAPDEAMVPTVRYWQMGNEPHNHSGFDHEGKSLIFSEIPDIYVRNYRAVSEALKAEDRRNLVGPCFDSWDVRGSLRPERKYVPALFHSAAIIDCIWYQPYIDSHGVWPDEAQLAATLQETAAYVVAEHHDRIVSHLLEAGRDPDTIEFGTSEFNFTCWYGSSSHLSQARMLGIAEMLFAQIEHDYVTASTWDAVCEHGVEWPVFKFMRAMHDCMGDVLVDVFRQGPLRLYAMRDSASGMLSFWALNLGRSDCCCKIILEDAPGCSGIKGRRLGNRQGSTALTDRNTLLQPECVTWSDVFAQSALAEDNSISFTAPGFELLLVTAETAIRGVGSQPSARRPARIAVDPAAHRQPPIRTSPAFLYPTIQPLPVAARLETVQVEADGARVTWSVDVPVADWFAIQRDDGDDCFKTVGIADRGQASFLDQHVAGAAPCTYRVVSRNARGCSTPSNVLPFTGVNESQTARAAILTDRTLVHFRFHKDDTAPGKLLDISGGDHHGVIHGAVWQVVDGVPCLYFNGMTDFVEIADLPPLAYGPGHEATILCRIWTRGGGTVLSRNPQYHRPVPRSADTEYWLGVVTPADVAKRKLEKFQFDKLEDAAGKVRWSGGTLYRSLRELAPETVHRVDDGRWRHIALVLRGDRGQLFLDGALEDVWVSDWNTPHACSTLIGARRNMYRNALDKFFEGALAELRVELRALTHAELHSLLVLPGS